jgi:uncharacterized protein YodC (DUF2158 family)
MKSETTKVGDLVTLKSSGRVMKVVQVHAKTQEVCVIPADSAGVAGIWVKDDAIEDPGLRSTNSTLSL